MVDRKREIFIRLEEIEKIVELLMEIKQKEEEVQRKFQDYDNLLIEENKLYENWNHYLDDVLQRLDHVTL